MGQLVQWQKLHQLQLTAISHVSLTNEAQASAQWKQGVSFTFHYSCQTQTNL